MVIPHNFNRQIWEIHLKVKGIINKILLALKIKATDL